MSFVIVISIANILTLTVLITILKEDKHSWNESCFG